MEVDVFAAGIRQLEMLCCFGCMSIVANYLVFMTLFPASLALVLEVCPCDPSNPAWHLDELAWGMREEEGKPNPVVQRVKVIMALGLLVVHLHSRFLSTVTGISLGLGPPEEEGSVLGGVGEGNSIAGGGDIEKVPLQEYLWWKAFNPSADQVGSFASQLLLVAIVVCVLHASHSNCHTFLFTRS